MKALNWLTTPDATWKPYAFDRVTVATSDGVPVSIIGKCYSKYSSGPSLFMLADAAAELTETSGHYGLKSCRKLGFRA